MTNASDPEHQRLAVLVGRWKTEGWTREAPGEPAARIDAADSYEWLPGGFALLHRVDGRVGGEKVEGAEILGYDPARRAYVTQYFGSDGPNAYEASLLEEDEGLVWTMHSRTDRFTGVFNDERNVITGRWDVLDADSAWRPWMDITLTKQSS
jgi:Protein of unknown function (DUF1579)